MMIGKAWRSISGVYYSGRTGWEIKSGIDLLPVVYSSQSVQASAIMKLNDTTFFEDVYLHYHDPGFRCPDSSPFSSLSSPKSASGAAGKFKCFQSSSSSMIDLSLSRILSIA